MHFLEVIAGNEVVLVYRANGPNPVGILVKVGTILPAHASPGAKAILAFSPNELVDRILKEKLTRYTTKTIMSLYVLKKVLKK